MPLEFIPFERVGEFVLNTQIELYTNKYDFEYAKSKNTEAEVYTLYDPDIVIWTENNLIDSIGCYDVCNYKQKNIIGISLEEFVEFSNEKPLEFIDELDFEDDNVPQFVYEFDTLGLQIWVKSHKIVSVIVSCALYP